MGGWSALDSTVYGTWGHADGYAYIVEQERLHRVGVVTSTSHYIWSLKSTKVMNISLLHFFFLCSSWLYGSEGLVSTPSAVFPGQVRWCETEGYVDTVCVCVHAETCWMCL